MGRRLRARARDDRGAVLIELALLLPFLSLLLFGTMEMGAAWVADARMDSATTQAARVGATSGNLPTSDRDLLLALRAALPSSTVSRLDRVVVYNATDPSSSVPTQCLAPVGSTADLTATGCNSYSGATVRAVSGSSMWGFGGLVGSKDSGWAPTARRATLDGPPDYLGVFVRARYEGAVGFPFPSLVLRSDAVFRINPDLSG